MSTDVESRSASARGEERGAPSAGEEVAVRETVEIQPRRGWIAVNWREIFEHRELLYFLVLRDVKVRYKQTVLGVAWAILQPLLPTVIFTVVFGLMAKMDSEGQSYAVFAFAGQWPWTFVANSVSQSGLSLVNQQHLLTKVYLPRLLVPFASVVGSLADFAVAGVVMAGLMVVFGVVPGWGALFVPVLVLIALATATGIGLILAALTVSYRDFRHLVPFMVQCWMFVSPVVYSTKIVPERWRWVLLANPMTGIIAGFRSALLGTPWDVPALVSSAVIATAVLVFGVALFRRMERQFADVV
jgi:lipopolysaccharide transport system permease protein